MRLWPGPLRQPPMLHGGLYAVRVFCPKQDSTGLLRPAGRTPVCVKNKHEGFLNVTLRLKFYTRNFNRAKFLIEFIFFRSRQRLFISSISSFGSITREVI